MSAFDYKAEYKRGSENTVADTLFCLPALTIGPAIDDPGEQLLLKCLETEGLPLADVVSVTTRDPLLQQVIHYVQSDWPHQKHISTELHPYYSIRTELSVESGCLI